MIVQPPPLAAPPVPLLPTSARELVVVGGLPGAGKSTLLRRLPDRDGARVLDPEHVAAALRAVVPAAVPYTVLRPMVHTGHWLRVVAAVVAWPGAVFVHDTATRRRSRWLLVALAALACRPRRLLWLDVPPAVARAGQVTRGRRLAPRAFAAHVRRASRLSVAGLSRGWGEVVVVRRPVEGSAHDLPRG